VCKRAVTSGAARTRALGTRPIRQCRRRQLRHPARAADDFYPASRGDLTMIDQSRVPAEPTTLHRDERSMRLMEYAMAIIAFAAAVLLSLR
jgi:hypothetical protein